MLSLPDARSLCFIGDSQVASVKHALDRGLAAPPAGYNVEFFAASGPNFRKVLWEDGVIRATGSAIEHVTRINAAGRDHIAPGQFDHLVFFGARLGVSEHFGSLLQWASEQVRWPSRAAMERSAHDFFVCARPYRYARDMAAKGEDVYFFPTPFRTDGVRDMYRKGLFFHFYPKAEQATREDRDLIWDVLQTVAARDGITLMRQPEETITKGVLTKPEFMCEGAVEAQDPSHKSPEFAALWLQRLWPQLASQAKAA